MSTQPGRATHVFEEVVVPKTMVSKALAGLRVRQELVAPVGEAPKISSGMQPGQELGERLRSEYFEAEVGP